MIQVERLTIITICYNDRAGLERTFASVFAQTENAFKYIVVDGGSTDGSVDLIKTHEGRITKWVSDKDEGIYDALNKGWQMAGTEFVLFLNAGDTLVGTDVIQRVLPTLTGDLDIAYGDAELVLNGAVIGIKTHPRTITSAYLIKETIAHQAQFIRKSVLEKLGGYDLKYKLAADYAFLAELFWKHEPRSRYLGFMVCAFDRSGHSSLSMNEKAVAEERKAIQRRYAPAFWFHLYHTYAAFNRVIGR